MIWGWVSQLADTRELVVVSSREGLRRWLADNCASGSSVWLVRPRKGEVGHIPVREISQELLCWGWIDSAVRKHDTTSSLLLISPRKSGSAWSGLNKRLVEAARREGAMTPAGEAAIERAKADGSWSFLDDVEALVVPDDLGLALRDANAMANWDDFPPSSRRGILEWIKTAKRPETRNRRVAETARLAARNIRALSPGAKTAS